MSGSNQEERKLFTAASYEPMPDEAGSRSEKIGMSNTAILSRSQRSNSDDEDADTKILDPTNTADSNTINKTDTLTTDWDATAAAEACSATKTVQKGQLGVPIIFYKPGQSLSVNQPNQNANKPQHLELDSFSRTSTKARSLSAQKGQLSLQDIHQNQRNRGRSSNSNETSPNMPTGRGANNALIALRGPPRSSPDSSDLAYLESNSRSNRSPITTNPTNATNATNTTNTTNSNPVKTYGNNRHTTKTVNRLAIDWEAAAAAEHGLRPRPRNNTSATTTNSNSHKKNNEYPYSKPKAFVPRSAYGTFNTTPNSTSNTTSGCARSTSKVTTKKVNEVVDLLSDDDDEVNGARKRRRLDQSDTTEPPREPAPHASTGTAGPSSSTTSTSAPNAATTATSTTTATAATTATTATSSTALLSSPPPLSSMQEYAVWQAKRDKDIAEIKNTLRDKELCALLSASEIDLLKSRLVQLMLQ